MGPRADPARRRCPGRAAVVLDDDDVVHECAFDDDWNCTGDLAELEDQGYRPIVGRTSDALRAGGEWVSPADIAARTRGWRRRW
jgi:acyl-coenzyme A synthetase/AMP-(fatty) acid ligase